MRNLPPRMSNQPARKAWEIEVPNGDIASDNFAKKQTSQRTQYSKAGAGVGSGAGASVAAAAHVNTSSSRPRVASPSQAQTRNIGQYTTRYTEENYLNRNQQVYDDTGSRIAYRGRWVARGGRGWGI